MSRETDIAERIVESADTFKCPQCGTKVLEKTGYCVKCKKKVKKARVRLDRETMKELARGVREWAAVERYGSFFAVDKDGTLLGVPMMKDGTPEMDRGRVNWYEVTAPENQRFLDVINRIFNTDYEFTQFAGR